MNNKVCKSAMRVLHGCVSDVQIGVEGCKRKIKTDASWMPTDGRENENAHGSVYIAWEGCCGLYSHYKSSTKRSSIKA